MHGGEAAVLKLARRVNLPFPRPFRPSTLSVILLFFPPLGGSCVEESSQASRPPPFSIGAHQSSHDEVGWCVYVCVRVNVASQTRGQLACGTVALFETQRLSSRI